MAKDNLKGIVEVVNNGKNYPAVKVARENPEVAALVSKMVESRIRPTRDQQGNGILAQSSKGAFDALSSSIMDKTNDGESMMQLFPDMELSKQIVVSSILSPKDMSGGDVIYTAPAGLLSPDVSATLIAKIKDYLDNTYKIKELLPKIIGESLFETGSYPIAVIPESSIDELINGPGKISMESLNDYVDSKGNVKPMGLLGDPRTEKPLDSVGLEAFTSYTYAPTYDAMLTHMAVPTGSTGATKKRLTIPGIGSLIRIVDNAFILKVPQAAAKNSRGTVRDLINQRLTKTRTSNNGYSISNEAHLSKLTDDQLRSLMYKNKARSSKQVVKVKTAAQAQRETIGRPLVLHLPPESVIPIHVPGAPEQHIGFFVIIDIEGNPVSRKSSRNHFGDLQSMLNNSQNSMGSYLTNRAKEGTMGANTQITIQHATQIYTDLIESDLSERLRNGVHGHNVAVARNEEVYRIMLARALANQTTQLLYIPAELLTYFAYKYDNNGIGKSLLDDMRVLNSLRAMMMFSRVMAGIKNSIGRTHVSLQLDEMDPDPEKTIEIAQTEIAKSRKALFPLGMNSPTDLVDWLNKSGMEFSYSGHPKIPEMKLDFDEKGSTFPKPDQELEDELKKRSIMGMGLPPEMVDNGFGSEFATTVVSQNILMAKRVTQWQDAYIPQITDHGRKVVTNNGTLVASLRSILVENYDKIKASIEDDAELKELDKEGVIDFFLAWFLESFELGLPRPNSVTLENQMAAFKIYADGLDLALDAWVNTNIINVAMAGQISNSVEDIKGILRGYYLRKWMAENNVFGELSAITTKDENGKASIDLFEIQKDHIVGFVHSAVRLLKESSGMAAAADKDIQAITGEAGLPESSAASTPSSGDSGSFGGDDGGGGGFDDFGLDGGSGDGTESPPGDEGNDDLTGAPEKTSDETQDDPTKPKPDLPPLENQP